MISRMSSAGRCSKNPDATSLDTPMAVPAMPSCITRWKETQGANRCWSIPAKGMSSKYDAHSANVRMNWNVSATTSIPSILLSLTAMATFTNASPHTMMVNAPSRSTRCCSSMGGKSTRRIERHAAGAIITAMPTAAPTMRPDSGSAAAARKHAAASAWMPARCRANLACGPWASAARQYMNAIVTTSAA